MVSLSSQNAHLCEGLSPWSSMAEAISPMPSRPLCPCPFTSQGIEACIPDLVLLGFWAREHSPNTCVSAYLDTRFSKSGYPFWTHFWRGSQQEPQHLVCCPISRLTDARSASLILQLRGPRTEVTAPAEWLPKLVAFPSEPKRKAREPRNSGKSLAVAQRGTHMAMGQNFVPANIPIPTKIGSKMGATPKWDPIGFDPQPYFGPLETKTNTCLTPAL